MKIVFFPQSCIPFHARTLDERPLGGIETAVIRLAEALDGLGHEVKVFTPFENPPLSSPLYLPHRALGDLGPVDVLIAVRDWQPALLPIDVKYRLFWTGDSYDQPQSIGIGDRRVVKAVDRLCVVSDWHAQTLCEASHFPLSKSYVLRNGVHAGYFEGSEARARKRLIYSSTPYRGLRFVPRIYRALQKKHPDVELHIFSGYGVYAGTPPPESALREYALMKAELEALPGCTVHGSVKQSRLAREFMRSSVLLYPNSFEETSCITAMEAQTAGCAVVTSALGALPETVGDAGLLIEGAPGSDDYIDRFTDAADRLLSDDRLFENCSAAAMKRAVQFDWRYVAKGFSEFLHSQVPRPGTLRQNGR